MGVVHAERPEFIRSHAIARPAQAVPAALVSAPAEHKRSCRAAPTEWKTVRASSGSDWPADRWPGTRPQYLVVEEGVADGHVRSGGGRSPRAAPVAAGGGTGRPQRRRRTHARQFNPAQMAQRRIVFRPQTRRLALRTGAQG